MLGRALSRWCTLILFVLLAAVARASGGFTAEYFRNRDWTDHRVTRTDAQLDGTQEPPVEVQAPMYSPNPGFSVRWSGYYTAAHTGLDYIYCYSINWSSHAVFDTYIDGDLVSHEDGGTPWESFQEPVAFTAGQSHHIEIVATYDYYQVGDVSSDPASPVFATDADGVIPSSRVTPAVVPQAPFITATPGANAITTTWPAISGAAQYEIYRATAAGQQNFASRLNAGPITGTGTIAYTDGPLDTRLTYYYRAKSVYTNPVTGTYTLSSPSNEVHGVRNGPTVPTDLIPNPALGILPDPLTLPGWMESTVPVDESGSGGDGPASSISVSLAHGVVDVDSGADLVLDNPTGENIVFERRYRSALAAANLSSPGLARGWTHNWDYRIVPLQTGAWGPLKLVYPNGASEVLTPTLDGSGNPTGAFTKAPGAPYIATGVPGSGFTWSSIKLAQNGLAYQTFTLPTGDNVLRLYQEVFSNGRGIVLTYTDRKLTQITNGGPGLSMTLLYGEAGGLLSRVTDNVTGKFRTYVYDGGGRLTKVVRLTGSGFEWIYGYTFINDAPYLNGVTTGDPLGTSRTATVSYNGGTGRASSVADAKGGSRTYAYDDAGSANVAIAGAAGPPDNYTVGFDSLKRTVSTTTAAGDTTTYQYGGADPSLVTHVTRPLGGAIDLQTDSHGNPTRVTAPYGNYRLITWEYPTDAPLGRIKSYNDYGFDGIAGAAAFYSYYGNGNDSGKRGFLQSVSTTDGYLEFLYTSLGSLYQVVGSQSYTLGYTYTDPILGLIGERYNKPTSVSEGGLPPSQIRYDVAGRVTAFQDPLGNITTPSYNTYNQLTALQLPLSKTLQIGYAVEGKAATSSGIVDGGVSRTIGQQTYDEESSLKSVIDGNSLSTGLTLDGKFDLTAVTNGGNRTMHQYVPDPVNRKLQNLLGTGTNALTLTGIANANGDVSSITGSDGRTATFARSSADPSLVLRAKFQDATNARIWKYFTYDSFGRVKKATTYPSMFFDPGDFDLPETVRVYSYDAGSRVTSVQTQENGPVERAYSYNADGTRASMYVAFNGFTLAPSNARYVLYKYSYETNQRLTDIEVVYADASKNEIVGTSLAWANYTYDNVGRVVAVRTPKAVTLYAYDQLGRLSGLQNLTPDGYTDPNAPGGAQVIDPYNGGTHTILSSFTNLTYDILGNRTGMQYTAMSAFGTGAPSFGSGSATWGYDNAGRLTSESWSGAASFSSSYAYDAGGNLTSLRSTGLPVDPLTDQLSRYTYNTSGDLTLGFTYTPEGRVKTTSGTSPYATTESYTATPKYDETGHRYSQDIATFNQGLNNTSTTTYVYDGDAIVQRYWRSSSGANPTSDLSTTDGHVLYLWGPTGVAMEFDLSGHSRAFTYDPQGNTIATADGRAQKPMFFDAYGKPIVTYVGDDRGRQQPLQYKGQFGYVLDQYSGLYYCINRYYSPALGRWTQRDPVGLEGGVNVYAYCNGNPIMLIDPIGLQWKLTLFGFEFSSQVVGNGLGTGLAATGEVMSFGHYRNEYYARQEGYNGAKIPAFVGRECLIQAGTLGLSNYVNAVRAVRAVETARTVELGISGTRGLNSFSKAAEYGIGKYTVLRKLAAGKGLQVHHLIEQRFKNVLGQKAGQMLSIVLTKEEHQIFTNLWRKFIPYGKGTREATPERVMEAAREIYKDYPEILKALGL